jgi:hypothetical protein
MPNALTELLGEVRSGIEDGGKRVRAVRTLQLEAEFGDQLDNELSKLDRHAETDLPHVKRFIQKLDGDVTEGTLSEYLKNLRKTSERLDQPIMTLSEAEMDVLTAMYSVGDRDATACDRCGYAGVPADHRPDPTPDESWPEALARFRGREVGNGDGGESTEREDGTSLEIDGRTYRASPDLADRWADLTEKQRNVVAELLRADDPADRGAVRAPGRGGRPGGGA